MGNDSFPHASPATSTAGRLAAVREPGALVPDDMDNLRDARQTATRIILDQRIADIEAGLEPGPQSTPNACPAACRPNSNRR